MSRALLCFGLLAFLLCSIASAQRYTPVRRFQRIINSNHYILKRDTMRASVVYCGHAEKSQICQVHDSLEVFSALREEMQAASAGDSADIRVTYNGFSLEARRAFQFAVDIWRAQIISDVPIRIFANWRSLGQGTLGSAYSGSITGSGLTRDFPGALREDTWYPMALAEKLNGGKLNEDREGDIVAQFNSELPEWYYGIDGNCPEDRYDLASVVLHEIGHGLGFFSTNSRDTVTNRNGFFGFYGYGTGYPYIFDRFIIDGSGRRLTDTKLFANPSKEILNLYTSNDLYFDGPRATSASQGIPPKLYAPAGYSQGSSIAHLDEFTYQQGDPNSLMGPIARKGEAIHQPGPITMGIMDDIGWRSVRIFHTPLPDREDQGSLVTIKAKVLSDDPLKLDSVLVFYSFDRLLSPPQSIVMTATGVPNEFSATLPSSDNGVVTYYIEARDVAGHVSVNPLKYPTEYNEFYVQRDVAKPFIFHQPINQRLAGDTIPITAFAVDNSSLKSVSFQYFINNLPQSDINLVVSNDSSLSYFYTGYFPAGIFHSGDSVRYRIVATDAARLANFTSYPDAGWLRFYVEKKLNPVSAYFNDFNSPTTDFLSQQGLFGIRKEPGFENTALHSAHPYKSGEYPFNFTSDAVQFRYPVVLKAPTSLLSFDEVLLVQASTTESDYRSTDFKDFVVVEGSKDKGYSWQVLADAYNSGANRNWRDAYLSRVDAQGNSLAKGNAALYKKRVMNLLLNQYFIGGRPGTNTEVGDTILIRFRIIADEAINGWGWAIDNFKIQTTPYESTEVSIPFVQDNLYLFPNPARGETNIVANAAQKFNSLNIQLRDVFGTLLDIQTLNFAATQSVCHTISLQRLRPGMYFLTINYGTQKLVRKLVVE